MLSRIRIAKTLLSIHVCCEVLVTLEDISYYLLGGRDVNLFIKASVTYSSSNLLPVISFLSRNKPTSYSISALRY